jgi:hypothetical protein
MGNDESNIAFSNGRTVSGKGAYVSHDTLFWADPTNHSQWSAPVDSIRNVSTVSRTLSAFLGLGIGAAIGAVVSLAETAGPHSDGSVGIVWLIAPPAGAVVGAGIGSLIGSVSRYEFAKKPMPATPGGSK